MRDAQASLKAGAKKDLYSRNYKSLLKDIELPHKKMERYSMLMDRKN